MLRLLYSLVPPTGFFYETEEGKVVLCFIGSAVGDCNFFTRHVLLSLGDFFNRASPGESFIELCEVLNPDETASSLTSLLT
jgi:hypothetical protein